MTAAPVPLRPTPDEYADFYAGYVAHVPDGDILLTLEAQLERLLALLGAIPAERWGFRYAPGKWSVREVVGHMIDAERVFSYRALRFARGDETPLAGFDEKAYVAAADFSARSLEELGGELAHLRRANVAFLRGLGPDAWSRRGAANGVSFTVRALAFIMAGHVEHHMQVLRKRYLIAQVEAS